MDQMELCEELEKKNGDELELLGQEEGDIVRKHLLSRFVLQTGTDVSLPRQDFVHFLCRGRRSSAAAQNPAAR